LSSHKLKNILVAPLDWGLGHTSRCIPVIRHLRDSGHKVVFGGNEWQIDFIYKTFPGIDTTYLEGYNVTYGSNAGSFTSSIIKQVPHILNTIRKEHQWLQQLCEHHHFDGIISDNRYGLYHRGIPSVIMTHQLRVRTGKSMLADNIFAWLHYKMLQRFRQCWVVDVPGRPNLSGKLAHPRSLPRNTKYIGLLSQFGNMATGSDEHLLVLLSGPEPQRSMLSAILWAQLQNYKGKVVFVEGSNDTEARDVPPHIQYHKQLTQSVLQPLLQNASMVICRSGYSSIMDLVALDKKAILIPTPGQTEQEYLAKHLYKQDIFYTAEQDGFDLYSALQNAAGFPFKKLPLADAYSQYQDVIDSWLLSLPVQ